MDDAMKSAKALMRLLDCPTHAVYIRDIRVHTHNFGAECFDSLDRVPVSHIRTPDQYESGFIVMG